MKLTPRWDDALIAPSVSGRVKPNLPASSLKGGSLNCLRLDLGIVTQ
jgi:hypothetical protein